jgi:ABC-type antimicrobial peptide transport system permease subunit
MQDIISKLRAYFGSGYLEYALWLILLGYILAYAVAFLLSRAGRSDRTILFRCRRAWSVALLVHLLAVTGVAVKWIAQYGYFRSFWLYFPWYLGMFIIDTYIIAAGLLAIDRISTYNTD